MIKKTLSGLAAILTVTAMMACGNENSILADATRPETEQQQTTTNMGDRKSVERFLDHWNEAMIAADTVALGEMMDDAIVLRHITGATQTKREWLEEVGRGSMKYYRIVKNVENITFRTNEDAHVAFRSAITANIWGSQGTWTINGTMRLVWRNGKWIRVE